MVQAEKGTVRLQTDPDHMVDIADWAEDLRQAGWKQINLITWESPAGKLYRGPYQAWKIMRWDSGYKKADNA